MNDNPKDHGGFTLVEVIIVCVMIGLLVLIAVPRINFQRARVDSAAVQVTSQLLLAQRIAVMRQYDVRVVFDSTKYEMTIHQDANNDGKVDTGEQTRKEKLTDGVQYGHVGAVVYGAGPSVTFEKDPISKLPTLVFHRNGSGSEEGAIHLTNRPAGSKIDDRVVRITRATGLAKCWNRRVSSTWTEGC